MTRARIISELMARYEQKRRRAERERDERVNEARSRDPEIARIQDGMARRFSNSTRRMLLNRDQSDKISRALREDTQRDQRSIRARLEALGLPEDFMSARYECPLCRDTGYAGEDRTRFCICFERELDKARWGAGARAEHRFEEFDPSIFADDEQRRLTERALKLCEEYADRFPDNGKSNLLLLGESGLGKTFLLDSIANRVRERGYHALRLTAFQMFEGMRAYHLGENGEEAPFRQMLICPLLLIDDLGTEPMFNNITREYIFLLLNERMGMHTVTASNLTLQKLTERYGERVSSRLVDKAQGDVVLLKGRDLRLGRKA